MPFETMMIRRLCLLAVPLLLGGCSIASRSRCLVGPDFTVLIKSNVPSALDGYDYLICPTPDGKTCDRYNRLQTLGPMRLSVSISDKDILVHQVGGSVGRFESDPSGMSDPNYKYSHPIYLTFSKLELIVRDTGIKGFIGDRQVPFQSCGA